MSAFHRQPSKVWWDSDPYSNPYFRFQRAQSSSPGSQDSGFSDTETSPSNAKEAKTNHNVNNNNVTTVSVTVTDAVKLTDVSLKVTDAASLTDPNRSVKVIGSDRTESPGKLEALDNNLSENVKEKCTPTKSNLRQLFEGRYRNGGPGAKSASPKGCCATSTPLRRTVHNGVNTEPAGQSRYTKHNINSVNRNLFKSIQSIEKHSNQYAKNITEAHLCNTNKHTQESNINLHNNSTNSICTEIPEETQSLPNIIIDNSFNDIKDTVNLNTTAPGDILSKKDIALSQVEVDLCLKEVGDNVVSEEDVRIVVIDSDSEVEEIFPPEYTSTPKLNGSGAIMKKDRLRRKVQNEKLMQKYKDERVPPVTFNVDELTEEPLKAWCSTLRGNYEPECMTALQGKSIAAELAERVATLAAQKTQDLRILICDGRVIHTEIEKLNRLSQLQPHASNLSTYIRSYLLHHPPPPSPSSPSPKSLLLHHCTDLSTLKSQPTVTYLTQLIHDFTLIHNSNLTKLVRDYLTSYLTHPRSELDVRASVTGLTSVCLHHQHDSINLIGQSQQRRLPLIGTAGLTATPSDFIGSQHEQQQDTESVIGCVQPSIDLIGLFVDGGAVELLIGLCEICEGSSVRRGVIRALATLCGSGEAVGRFERGGGVEKVVVDVVTDDALPEIERAEAVALLAQIMAPWIDPPPTLPSIHPHLRPLSRSLTLFARSTRCRQNLLLCSAALANLTTLYSDCVRHYLEFDTVEVLLKCVKRGGNGGMEVYVLEQVALVIANVSATEQGRSHLTTSLTAASALVCFLQTKHATAAPHSSDSCHLSPVTDASVVQRLQQKAIIALSRLCGDARAADRVVEMGGVRRLVELCREKGERYGSDAVLVAALATLRKITETCGGNIMTEQDAQELVEPRLLDSFLAYSAQNESLV